MFSLLLPVCLLCELCWSIGLISGMFVMFDKEPAILNSPSLNGTWEIYSLLLVFQFTLILASMTGLVLSFRAWTMNSGHSDSEVSRGLSPIWYLLWFSHLIGAIIGNLVVGIYGLARGKEPEGQLGFMYDMFHKNGDQPEFVATFERLQHDRSCCGVYGPSDWFKVQLSQQPIKSAGGSGDPAEFREEQELLEKNHVTGNCHLTALDIEPEGCGQQLLVQVNESLILYCTLALVGLLFGFLAGILSLCSFKQLKLVDKDKEPEDETSTPRLKSETSEMVVVVDYDDEDGDAEVEKGKIIVEVEDENKISAAVIHSQAYGHPPSEHSSLQHQTPAHFNKEGRPIKQEELNPIPIAGEIIQHTSIESERSNSNNSVPSEISTESGETVPTQNKPSTPTPTMIHIGYVRKDQLQSTLHHSHGSESVEDVPHAWKVSRYKVHPDEDDYEREHGQLYTSRKQESSNYSSSSRNREPERKGSTGFDIKPSYDHDYYSHSHQSREREPEDEYEASHTFHSSEHESNRPTEHSRDHHSSATRDPHVESIFRAGSSFNDNAYFSHFEMPSTSTAPALGYEYLFGPHSSATGSSPSHKPPLTEEKRKEMVEKKIIEKEEKAILRNVLHGGKVIGEIKVEHKFDSYGNPIKDDDKRKRATLTIVRNPKVKDPAPPPGHHGQTGHLAEDIAEMSGKAKHKIKIEDLELTTNGAKAREPKKLKEPSKKVFGSVTPDTAQKDLEDLISSSHIRKQQEEEERKKEEEQARIKPHYLVVAHPNPERAANVEEHEHKYYHYLPTNRKTGHQNYSQVQPSHHLHHEQRSEFREEHELRDRDLYRYLGQEEILRTSREKEDDRDRENGRGREKDLERERSFSVTTRFSDRHRHSEPGHVHNHGHSHDQERDRQRSRSRRHESEGNDDGRRSSS